MYRKDQSTTTDKASGSSGRATRTVARKTPERQRLEDLPPAAQRALREAAARREKRHDASDRPAEVGGRGGKDPARYGDWEIDGRAIDF